MSRHCKRHRTDPVICHGNTDPVICHGDTDPVICYGDTDPVICHGDYSHTKSPTKWHASPSWFDGSTTTILLLLVTALPGILCKGIPEKVEAVSGWTARLPCRVNNVDLPLLVLWFRHDNDRPFYSFDIRNGSGSERQYNSIGMRAHFIMNKSHTKNSEHQNSEYSLNALSPPHPLDHHRPQSMPVTDSSSSNLSQKLNLRYRRSLRIANLFQRSTDAVITNLNTLYSSNHSILKSDIRFSHTFHGKGFQISQSQLHNTIPYSGFANKHYSSIHDATATHGPKTLNHEIFTHHTPLEKPRILHPSGNPFLFSKQRGPRSGRGSVLKELGPEHLGLGSRGHVTLGPEISGLDVPRLEKLRPLDSGHEVFNQPAEGEHYTHCPSNTTSLPPFPGCLELSSVTSGDNGSFTCRVEFVDSPTQTHTVLLTVY
ncbi:uncharacterized protein LOC125178070, partial [Hyalella azteca]|uniref:Uncharacterized protein LOC125178070 n=1 Tax=Hyalella azteca TaxID=294128 RepID=A0A979FK67_HYAAZ